MANRGVEGGWWTFFTFLLLCCCCGGIELIDLTINQRKGCYAEDRALLEGRLMFRSLKEGVDSCTRDVRNNVNINI
uniref:Putative secreted peptide n=1 Tax=Anopheles braziliensis TaxID=58242 RepID=A0A2M3ZX79_9DIPT